MDGGGKTLYQRAGDGGTRGWSSRTFGGAWELRLEPWLKIPTHTSDYKAFQNKNVVEIPDEVLDEYPRPKWKNDWWKVIRLAHWQVQYGETDFDFVQRLMQGWGIYWRFEHSENSHTLVLADAINVHKACADSPLVCYCQKGLELDKEFVHAITANESPRSGQWVLESISTL
ncbi:phage late control D family protein [Escherichia coli]|nr:phage late control D family protein [Escherichia coli]